MKKEEIKDLVKLLEDSKLNKIQIKDKEFEILLEKMPENNASFIEKPISHQKNISENQVVETKQKVSEEGDFITSPMVGTYYSSPAPDKPPFVKVGDIVTPDTVVCIIEAMKVMNEVKAGFAGKITKEFYKNASPVEFGTKLYKVD